MDLELLTISGCSEGFVSDARLSKVLVRGLFLFLTPLCLLSEHGFVRFHTLLPSTVYAKVHKSHTIQVEVEAYPPPSIVWLKNNKTLTMESSSEFTITSRNLSETR